jgi:hypothetical protein
MAEQPSAGDDAAGLLAPVSLFQYGLAAYLE